MAFGRTFGPSGAKKPVAEIFSAGPSDSPDDDRRKARNNALEGYAITKIGLSPPRPALYARIDARVNEMLAAGWLDEVRALVSPEVPDKTRDKVRDEVRDGVRDEVREKTRDKAPENVRGIAPDAKPFQFIGYSDLRAHLEGTITLAAAVTNIQQSTRRFAKRQLTWFRREPDVPWLESFGDADETIAAALDLIATRSSS